MVLVANSSSFCLWRNLETRKNTNERMLVFSNGTFPHVGLGSGAGQNLAVHHRFYRRDPFLSLTFSPMVLATAVDIGAFLVPPPLKRVVRETIYSNHKP